MKTPREILIAISELPIHEAIKMLRDDMGLEATQVLHALTRASLTPRGKCYRVALRPFVSVAGARKIQAIKIIREEFSFNLKGANAICDGEQTFVFDGSMEDVSALNERLAPTGYEVVESTQP